LIAFQNGDEVRSRSFDEVWPSRVGRTTYISTSRLRSCSCEEGVSTTEQRKNVVLLVAAPHAGAKIPAAPPTKAKSIRTRP